jgi:hypothetical protein
MLLLERSYDIHQLAQELQLDYKAIQNHMKLLEKNYMILKIVKRGHLHVLVFHTDLLDLVIYKLDPKMNQKDLSLTHSKFYYCDLTF